jgi:hypothetical protein
MNAKLLEKGPILASLSAALIVTSAPRCQAQAALVLGNANPNTYGLPSDLQLLLT